MLDVHGFGATWLLLFVVNVFVLVAVIRIDLKALEARLLLPTVDPEQDARKGAHVGGVIRDLVGKCVLWWRDLPRTLGTEGDSGGDCPAATTKHIEP